MLSISIIIPTKQYNFFLEETLKKIEKQTVSPLEVIVLPDFPFEKNGVTIIPTGEIGPGEKRDIGAKSARGDILAFIDDDAYPEASWLEEAIKAFKKEEISAVGGPAITPSEDPFWARVSGAFYLSTFGGGKTNRYSSEKAQFVTDWPTVNLLVRKKDFLEVGGFDTRYWPGEDTKFCRDLLVNLHKKIWYEPKAIVYHHRRSGLVKHLIQVGRYGLHRGYFTKVYPENSRRLFFYVPSIFLLFFIISLFFLRVSSFPLFLLMSSYFIALILNTAQLLLKKESLWVAIAAQFYTFLSHLSYGYHFLRGAMLTRNLESKLGR